MRLAEPCDVAMLFKGLSSLMNGLALAIEKHRKR